MRATPPVCSDARRRRRPSPLPTALGWREGRLTPSHLLASPRAHGLHTGVISSADARSSTRCAPRAPQSSLTAIITHRNRRSPALSPLSPLSSLALRALERRPATIERPQLDGIHLLLVLRVHTARHATGRAIYTIHTVLPDPQQSALAPPPDESRNLQQLAPRGSPPRAAQARQRWRPDPPPSPRASLSATLLAAIRRPTPPPVRRWPRCQRGPRGAALTGGRRHWP